MIEKLNDDLPLYDEFLADKQLFADEEFEETVDSINSFTKPTNKYSLTKTGMDTGYYQIKGIDSNHLSDFYIEITKWVRTLRDGEPLSYYEGEIYFSDGSKMNLTRITASTLEDPASFKKYIGNQCGPKAMIIGSPPEVIKAIKTFNKEIPLIVEREFGYNDAQNTYYTEDLVITAREIIEYKTPIKFSDRWGKNKLGFNYKPIHEAESVKKIIINNFISWDESKLIFPLLAFAFYPLIYSLIKRKNFNKFYLMLKGPSGSGKSQMSKWIQNFYGEFQTLIPWNSTDTAINIVGSAFKDAILAVDDLKAQNFRTENDAKKVMTTL